MTIVFLGKYNESELLTGPEKVAKRLFREVSKSTPSALFVDYFFKESSGSNLWSRVFGKVSVGQNGSVVRLGLFRLLMFLLKTQPRIIHIVAAERFVLPLFLYRFFLKSRIIATIHGIVKHEKRLFKGKETAYSRFKDLLLESYIMRNSDELVFVSEPELALAKSYYSIDVAKVRIIPNGIDEEFSMSPEKFYDGSTLNIVAFDRGMLGSSSSEDLINLLARFKGAPLSLSIIGGDKKRAFLEEGLKVHSVDKMDGEHFCSFLNDKHLYINNGVYESFSIMAVECMAAGVVPIVAGSVGMSYLIKNGFNGFVYDQQKPESILDILEKIALHYYDLQTLSGNARLVYNDLSWSNIAHAYNSIYLR